VLHFASGVTQWRLAWTRPLSSDLNTSSAKQFRKDLSAVLPDVWRMEILTSTDSGKGPRMVLGPQAPGIRGVSGVLVASAMACSQCWRYWE
jgi:hypothetical protein